MAIRTGAWLLAVTSVLVGCSSETTPRTLPPVASVSPSAAFTASPAPVLPSAATAATPQAAGLFDLKADPDELRNLYGGAGTETVTVALKAELERLRGQYRDTG